ncbi:MAG: hypothetical protein HUU38_07925 [Anaerolineales bacterium]|jgi:hypothetical protein|nr:hypothetical protein [Anaerolineales bacterium]
MDEQALTDFVIRELGKHRRRSDVVMDVCERTGMDWPTAQKFVYQVEFDNRKVVAARQSPLAVIFGAAFVLGGFALALVSVIATAQGISIHYRGIPYVGNMAGLVFGVLLIAGGVLGLWETIRKFM